MRNVRLFLFYINDDDLLGHFFFFKLYMVESDWLLERGTFGTLPNI